MILTLALFCWGAVAHAAEQADIPASIGQLRKVIPDLALNYSIQPTRSRAYVSEEASSPQLVIDPEFLAAITPTALLFVIAHEYAHVFFQHQKKLAVEAMRLAALPTPELAYDALASHPVQQEKLDSMNRQFELDADEQAVKWLSALDIVACSTDVLASIDDGGVSMAMDRSHPGFYTRKQVICKNKPQAFVPAVQ
ncbi:MAG TPA: M48 family metalloprotease [Limnobacter sp.]|uniref:M48 family metalloprotease n=1 Tax=Limnobacter sp. TaxID=2003368 RepID=UPI002E35DE99|nr:M48 family metalloprotease [Limnobacter sp.]HEX5485794.1 M48 family metalloprotease [Limnobacter sp.]